MPVDVGPTRQPLPSECVPSGGYVLGRNLDLVIVHALESISAKRSAVREKLEIEGASASVLDTGRKRAPAAANKIFRNEEAELGEAVSTPFMVTVSMLFVETGDAMTMQGVESSVTFAYGQ